MSRGGTEKAISFVMLLMGVVIGLGIAMLYGSSSTLVSAVGLSLMLAGVGGVLTICGLRRIIRNEQD